MPIISWTANPRGRYLIDVMLEGLIFEIMIDTGVVSTAIAIGFDLEQNDFDILRSAGRLSDFRKIMRRDASGQQHWVDTAEVKAQLFDKSLRIPVGPIVRIRAACGMPNVISRVGVEFFHCLTGCSVNWDLDAQLWCVAYP